jgi:general secretion pathway protein G
MIQRLNESRRKSGEGGFTLIELLIVIVILGILAAIVVFAVGGITDRGQTSACSTDKKTLQTAEEANYAKNSAYVSEAQLVTNGFLQDVSNLDNITLNAGPPQTYTITIQDAKCGTVGAAA